MRQCLRRYHPWTDTELKALQGLARSRSLDELAELLMRTRSEVREMATLLQIPEVALGEGDRSTTTPEPENRDQRAGR